MEVGCSGGCPNKARGSTSHNGSYEETLSAQDNVAEIYRQQGRLENAERLNMGIPQRRRETLGLSHPSTLTSLSNLADAYRGQGRLKEAEELNREARKRRISK
ncbi:hypothetical protein VTN02DRAFT_1074 [Thermoascus thermophilus]